MSEHRKLTEYDEETGEPYDVCPSCSDDWPCVYGQLDDAKAALRLVYGYAEAIRRMSVFAPIGFRCSLILETVSRALPDDEAKRLHDTTKVILDTLTEQ